ncbi:MAG TPA: carbamoyltransferase C-terminal domain-containing protein [Vicinamibacterales bacterium]|nr:carbamoyltransferase C-terminal domain-containing protein [Vicinamibacterales bacterium]
MNILGVWDGHDAGAALLADGRIVAAVNEERLTRRKLDVAFPSRSIELCLALGGVTPASLDVVASCTSDVAKALGRLVPSTKESYYRVRRRLAPAGRLSEIRSALKYRITEWPPNPLSRAASRWSLRRTLGPGFEHAALRIYDHHESHAASAAFASGFESCVVVTIDGLGDGKAATASRFRDGRLELLASTSARHSPGVFFEHVTHLLNMRELEDEGKVMALADYASPVPDAANPLLTMLGADGLSFRTSRAGHRLHRPLAAVQWGHSNEQFAFMAQRALGRACVDVVARAVEATGERRVALAGGVASNVKINRTIRALPGVEAVFVFPHMGDGGLAVGAAALAARERGGAPALDLPDSLDLGPSYDSETIAASLQRAGLAFRRCANLPAAAADLLAAGRVVLWFDGRMEYGPRALGHRSVLARPDRPGLRDRLNRVLKKRNWYQPFCPSMLDSDARVVLADYTDPPCRHMTMAYQVGEAHRDALSGVTNVDGSCRPQMVPDASPDRFADLLRCVRERIGLGAVLNTSFNVHGSPLVCTPDEAAAVFAEGGADAMAIGPFLVLAPT